EHGHAAPPLASPSRPLSRGEPTTAAAMVERTAMTNAQMPRCPQRPTRLPSPREPIAVRDLTEVLLAANRHRGHPTLFNRTMNVAKHAHCAGVGAWVG